MLKVPIIDWYPVNAETVNEIPQDTELMFVIDADDGVIFTGKCVGDTWYGYDGAGLSRRLEKVTHFAPLPATPGKPPAPPVSTPEITPIELGAYICAAGLMAKQWSTTTVSNQAVKMAREIHELIHQTI